MQLPIGKEDNFEGVIDLITMEAVYFDGPNGENVRREPIPADIAAEAEAARQHMLESAVHVQRRDDGADAGGEQSCRWN